MLNNNNSKAIPAKFLMTLTIVSLHHKVNTRVRKYQESNKQHSEIKHVDNSLYTCILEWYSTGLPGNLLFKLRQNLAVLHSSPSTCFDGLLFSCDAIKESLTRVYLSQLTISCARV